MRRTGSKIIFCCLCLIFGFPFVFSQNNDRIELERDFPVLSKRADAQSADFVMAIDRSGSMKTFWPVVRKSLGTFLESVPDGDYVSVVAFGTDAGNLVTPRPLNRETRQELLAEIEALPDPADGSTDLGRGLEKTLDELNRPNGKRLKFVFLFTDFVHEPARESPYFNKTAPEDGVWKGLATRRANEQNRNIVQSYALLLPLGGNVGRDLKLGEAVFPGMERVNVSRETLLPWFERRKAEIARDKLRGVVADSVRRVPLKLHSVEREGDEIVARFAPAGERIVETSEIAGLKVENADFGELAEHLTPADLTDRKFVFSDGEEKQVSIPVARIRDSGSLWAWSEEAEISFDLSGTESLAPADEIKRLNLPTAPVFTIGVEKAKVEAGGGFLAWWHLLVAGLLVLLVLAAVVRYYRKEYIVGQINVVGEDQKNLRTADKCRRFEVGRTEQKDGIAIKGVEWTLLFEALSPPKRSRGVYVSVAGQPLSAAMKSSKGKEVILGSRPQPITRGAEITIDDTIIWFN